jgi:hypothetical protein
MKDEDPLVSPFIGEPRCGQPAKVGGRAAIPCGQNSPICPQGAVVETKGKIVEGKEGKRGERWPTGHRYLAGRPHLASTQLPLSFFTTSCSSRAHTTDQKHQK